MVQIHGIKKKFFHIMNIIFYLLSKVFEVIIKNITFMI